MSTRHRPCNLHRARPRLLVALALCLAGTTPAWAAAPASSVENTCTDPGGRGDACASDADCVQNAYASVCAKDASGVTTCQIPCADAAGAAVPASCSLGETCTEGKTAADARTWLCQPSRFRMDLNLLDRCLFHFLSNTAPVFRDDQCSLERNLTALLDQDADRDFDLFDLDLCVLAFLEQPGCDPTNLTPAACEAPDLVPCGSDADCGLGLYCDASRNVCQRDCGVVAARDEVVSALDRECTAALTSCDRERGRCLSIDASRLTCEVDRDCPPGAYCFLGRCAPRCYRVADCPSGEWLCSQNNKCRAAPRADLTEGFEFDPLNFAVRFARDNLKLDAVADTDSTEVVIIDLLTRRRVIDNPAVSFGYRLEVSYGLKQDAECLKPFVDCSVANQRPPGQDEATCVARQEDCLIRPDEEWIRLNNPFGVVSAGGNPTIEVALEAAVADRLSAGVYPATLRAFFDNGDTDTVRVTLVKASPSGEYSGSLSVYLGSPNNLITGNRPLQVSMRLKVEDHTTRWNDLMAAQNLAVDEDLVDITRGFEVRGLLHGNAAFAFTRGGAQSVADNEIPLVGIYSPELNTLRVVGVIELEPDFCIGESGPCDPSNADELKVRNPFRRKIRRRIQFIGPFDETLGRFHGIYREKVAGLASDFDITLEGGFLFNQVLADESPLDHDAPLLEAGAERVRFPTDAEVLADLDALIDEHCGPLDSVAGATLPRGEFRHRAAFEAYLQQGRRTGPALPDNPFGRTTVFPDLLDFSASIEVALTALGTDPAGQQNHLNVYDFLSSRILPCDPDDPQPAAVCVREDEVRCGLALHQKALLSGWVDLDEVRFVPTAASNQGECPPGQLITGQGDCVCPAPDCECPEGEERDTEDRCRPLQTGALDLFCVDTIAASGCAESGALQPALFTLQEHNRFWKHLGEILRFSGGRDRSDAFLVLFRNEVNPFAQGAALSFKVDKLRSAVASYDALVDMIVGPEAAKVLFTWPARAFAQVGNDWMGIFEAAMSERLNAVAELVDIKRRIFAGTGDADFIFAQHLMQHEYLQQIYLMALQEHWQRELFAWLGDSGILFEQGQRVLSQLNPAKNAIGVTPNRVFFENRGPGQSNWEGYRELIVGADGDSGLLGDAEATVDDAVDNLQSALDDLDTLEQTLHDQQVGLSGELDAFCGDPDPTDPTRQTADYCQYLMKQYADLEEWQRIRDCKFKRPQPEGCPDAFQFNCEEFVDIHEQQDLQRIDVEGFSRKPSSGAICEIVNTFVAGTDQVGDPAQADFINAPPTCALNKAEVRLNINGTARPCVGGDMGALLQEKALLDLQRRQTIGSLETVARQIENIFAFAEEIEGRESTLLKQQIGITSTILVLNLVNDILGTAGAAATEGGDAINCLLIAGLAAGTDCPQKAASKVLSGTLISVFGGIQAGLNAVAGGLEVALERLERDFDRNERLTENNLEMLQLIREADGLIDEYNALTQEAFNVGAQIDDLRYQVQSAVDTFNSEVRFVAEHLVGRETGNLLLGQALVSDASDAFREILDFSYRMTVAFIHHFNVAPGEATNLINRAQALVTLDDVADFVGLLDARSRDYCGQEGIDCDAAQNIGVLRFSVRDVLFSHLRDAVDAQGNTVTAGEQFHNEITRPPYLVRRIRGNLPTDQIELLLPLPMNLRENTGGPAEWLIGPLSCNHLLDGRRHDTPAEPDKANGTLAVNMVGRNLDGAGQGVHYELIRGATDYVRSCTPESVVREVGTLPVLEYPIRTHVVGYAPQNPLADRDAPPSFVTRSQELAACVNEAESHGSIEAGSPCWRWFARDRSLASLDWKLVLPMAVGDGLTSNAWIAGEGLSADQRPVIEDIVVYFRYRSRPVQEF